MNLIRRGMRVHTHYSDPNNSHYIGELHGIPRDVVDPYEGRMQIVPITWQRVGGQLLHGAPWGSTIQVADLFENYAMTGAP